MPKSSSKLFLGETQLQKSPAEFFAENQAIAGFDNLGKSLYTSIRELIENSLDACESIGELPTIQVKVQELTQAEFNKIRGISATTKDLELFQKGKAKPNIANDASKKSKRSVEGYFRISVKDNGCGMQHDKIPDLLGRVLSGSKYGVRQTRGKFGLGAKMALIWSKKSTGVPIQITTSHRPKGGPVPTQYSTCTLDMDIAKNIPKIISHKKHPNAIKQWTGTQLEILIAGNFTTYKARIVQYLRELAIVTPYAALSLEYENLAEPQRNMQLRYDRRSEQMPPPSKQVHYHPSSVNNLVIQQLLDNTKQSTLPKFLEKELSCVTSSVAKRICHECGWDEDLAPHQLTDRQITRLVQVLRTVQLFKAPDGSCLSPLGEYNLNLGIRKVLEPDYVATARDRPCAYEGHPFVVEAAVSLGGKDVKEGINVIRFANRIPLLFEAGADVSTRVAQNKIKWSSYKMDYKRDRIGVFVSIVSTKIPYKGTGKEYIGDDITEISHSVKRALQSCCQQLRTHLQKRNALREQKERQGRLTKYIPDVTRSLIGLLQGMQQRHETLEDNDDDDDDAGATASSPRKRPRIAVHDRKQIHDMVDQLKKGTVSEQIIKESLEEAVKIEHSLQQEQELVEQEKIGTATPLYLIPQFSKQEVAATTTTTTTQVIEHPLFSFRPMRSISP